MTTIDTKQVLVNFKGEKLKNEMVKSEGDLTIGFVLSHVLSGQTSNPALSWILGKKFATEDQVDLKAEEVVFIKNELEKQKTWLSLVSGQVLEIIDGKKSQPTDVNLPKKKGKV